MPYLTDLATAARKSGLKVVEEPGWKARGHGPMNGVRTIACHHTAGPAKGNMPSLAVIRDGRTGLAGPLAHLGLGRDGTVYVIAAGLCYHAGAVGNPDHSNPWALGIEAEATGVDKWPAVQMDAYARLCAALAKHYGAPVSRVLGHKEIATPKGRKVDPNFDMDAFRKSVKEAAPVAGDKNQKTRRAILAAEKKGAAFVAALAAAEKEARAAGQKGVADRMKTRIKSEKAYLGRLKNRRVALRPKKK